MINKLRYLHKKFPDFDKFYNKNKENMVIYAVGLKVRWQKNVDLEKMSDKLDYDFPFSIAGVPTMFIYRYGEKYC